MKDEVKKFKKEIEQTKRYTLNETAELVGMAPRTISTRLKKGDFPNAVKVGREWRIPEEDIRNFLNL